MTEGKRRPGRRSEEEAKRTRARILDCAESLFARQGFEGLSTREVARVAGVHNQTVHHHFGTKARLFEAVVKRWDDELLQKLAEALAKAEGGSFESLVDASLDVLIDYFVAKRDWVAVTARLSMGEDLPADVELGDRTWTGFMQRGLAQVSLDLSEEDRVMLLFTIEGAVRHHVLSGERYRRLLGRDIEQPAQREATKAHLKRSILALIHAHTGAAR